MSKEIKAIYRGMIWYFSRKELDLYDVCVDSCRRDVRFLIMAKQIK